MGEAAAMVALDCALGRTLLEQADPADALRSSEHLRRDFPDADPSLIAAALTQVGLGQRARTRFGSLAGEYLWTSDGLEQASRPGVARYRADRLRALGVSVVADLTCGLGADATAFARAGLDVVGIERDPDVAELARINARRANLGARIAVTTGDCTDPAILGQLPTQAWFIDPARRDPTAARRRDGSTRRIDDPHAWSPPWEWVRAQAERAEVLVVKAAPGIAHGELDGAATEWLSQDGSLLEACAWWGGAGPQRAAVLLDASGVVRLRVEAAGVDVPAEPGTHLPHTGDLLLDPDPAIIRAGVVTEFGEAVGAQLVDERLAFLTAQPGRLRAGAWVGSRVWQILSWGDYQPRQLTAIAAEHGITRIDVVGRGRTLDATRVRRELGLPGGPGAAGTLIVAGLGTARRTTVALARAVAAPDPAFDVGTLPARGPR